MSTDENQISDQLRHAAHISGLGGYESSHRPPFRIPWMFIVLPAILLVTGLLNAFGVIEMELEVRQQGPVSMGISLFGAAIGAAAITVGLVKAVRATRQGGVHLYQHGFIIETRSATLLRYDTLLAQATRGGNGRTVYQVRTRQQPTWTTVPEVTGIDRLGPMFLQRAGNVSAPGTPGTPGL